MGSGAHYAKENVRLTKSQQKRIFDYETKYSGMEAVTESYVEIVNGVKIIRTRTRYRKKRRRNK